MDILINSAISSDDDFKRAKDSFDNEYAKMRSEALGGGRDAIHSGVHHMKK